MPAITGSLIKSVIFGISFVTIPVIVVRRLEIWCYDFVYLQTFSFWLVTHFTKSWQMLYRCVIGLDGVFRRCHANVDVCACYSTGGSQYFDRHVLCYFLVTASRVRIDIKGHVIWGNLLVESIEVKALFVFSE